MEFGNARKYYELYAELEQLHRDLEALLEDLPTGVRLVVRFKLRAWLSLFRAYALRVEQGENELARRIAEVKDLLK